MEIEKKILNGFGIMKEMKKFTSEDELDTEV